MLGADLEWKLLGEQGDNDAEPLWGEEFAPAPALEETRKEGYEIPDFGIDAGGEVEELGRAYVLH